MNAGFFGRVSPLSLAFVRVCFGLILALDCWYLLERGWIEKYWAPGEFHFTYLGFSWVEPWPGSGMYWHVIVTGIAALALMLGVWVRLTAGVFFLGFSYLFLIEQTRYLNHFYLVILLAFLFIFLPSDAAISLASRKGNRFIPRGAVWLLRAQIGLVYFFAGVAKLNRDWLHARPLDDWLESRADMAVIGPLLAHPWAPWLFSFGGLGLDLLAFPLLCWRPTRLPTFGLILVFHLLNAWIFGIGIFPWLMIAVTTIFFAPEWPRTLWSGWSNQSLAKPEIFRHQQRWILAGVAVYLGLQILIPLRHFAYPGSVHWTEEGHMFSWHMKLRSKSGKVTFLVKDVEAHHHWVVDPRFELDRVKVKKMSGRPDLVLQYAHHLAGRFEAEERRVAVHANVSVSLNGHTARPLIDPSVDLTTVSRSLSPAPWILR